MGAEEDLRSGHSRRGYGYMAYNERGILGEVLTGGIQGVCPQMGIFISVLYPIPEYELERQI